MLEVFDHPWILTAIPAWMAFMLLVVLGLAMLMFRTIGKYHEDVIQVLEHVMTGHTTSMRLMFQFMMSQREPEIKSIGNRLQAIEEKLGIANMFPLPEKARAELLDDIKKELAAISGVKDSGQSGNESS